MGGQILTLASQKSEAIGEAKGEAKGKAEIIRYMRANGASVDEIVRMTGVQLETVEGILNNRIAPIVNGNILS